MVRCKMDKILYAAYGSNLHPIRLSSRVPSAKLLGKGILNKKVIRFHKSSKDGSGKCNVVNDDKHQTYVAIYSLDASEKPLLDTIEGVGYGYQIEEVNVADFGTCYTYIADQSHIYDSLNPYTWYKELVLVGCINLGFPSDYIERIYNIDADIDSDQQRHSKHMRLVAHAKNNSMVFL